MLDDDINPIQVKEETEDTDGLDVDDAALPETIIPTGESTGLILPPRADLGVVPTMEWWDEIYLPREIREIRKKAARVGASSSGSSGDQDHYSSASILNIKTYQ